MPDLSKLQAEVDEWTDENFPNQPHENPYMGIFEEGGELVHSVLKIRQGIREDDEDVGLDAELDSVGDIVVYTADYCANRGIDMAEGYQQTSGPHTENQVDAIKEFAKYYGLVSEVETTGAANVSSMLIGKMLHSLEAFCSYKPFSLDDAIEFAWYDEVIDREWDSSYRDEPVTDGGNAEEELRLTIDGKEWHVRSEYKEYDATHTVAGALLAGADDIGIERREL